MRYLRKAQTSPTLHSATSLFAFAAVSKLQTATGWSLYLQDSAEKNHDCAVRARVVSLLILLFLSGKWYRPLKLVPLDSCTFSLNYLPMSPQCAFSGLKNFAKTLSNSSVLTFAWTGFTRCRDIGNFAVFQTESIPYADVPIVGQKFITCILRYEQLTAMRHLKMMPVGSYIAIVVKSFVSLQ